MAMNRSDITVTMEMMCLSASHSEKIVRLLLVIYFNDDTKLGMPYVGMSHIFMIFKLLYRSWYEVSMPIGKTVR